MPRNHKRKLSNTQKGTIRRTAESITRRAETRLDVALLQATRTCSCPPYRPHEPDCPAVPGLQPPPAEDARPTEPVPRVLLENLDIDLETLDPDTDECDSEDGRLAPLTFIQQWAGEVSIDPSAATHLWRGAQPLPTWGARSLDGGSTLVEPRARVGQPIPIHSCRMDTRCSQVDGRDSGNAQSSGIHHSTQPRQYSMNNYR